MIFVALAIGWAVYLLPKALRHHEEEDRRRSVKEFSDSVRVVGRGRPPVATGAQTRPPLVEPVETPAARPQTSRAPVEPVETPAARPQTRQAAASAARRRRRVLALLLSTLVVVSATSYLSYTPRYSIAIPTVLIVAFLVIARLTVRAQQLRPVAPVQPPKEKTSAAPVYSQAAVAAEVDLEGEDTQGLSRDELAEVIGEPVLDEGGLWDPLPMTLPTYVNKARARRTVRTVELTASGTGVTSSGHDAADSALAREAELQAEVEAAVEIAEPPAAAAGA